MLANEFPEDLQKCLLNLRTTFEQQVDAPRREYVRKCMKSHEFFRGNQYIWFDVRTGEYRAPTNNGGLMVTPYMQNAQSLYVVNIYQGFALSMIAILTSNHPTQKFFPMTADSPEDQATAEKANEFVEIFRKRTKSFEQLLDEVYLLWCEGTFGSYVHTVADGERFGWRTEDITEPQQVPVGYETYRCLSCGAVSPTNVNGMCQGCGAPYTDDSIVPAPIVNKRVKVGERQVPRERVVRDVVSGLEMMLPPTAKSQSEFPYLIRKRELPKAMVRATYREIADRIVAVAPGGQDGSIEKRARLQTAQGSTIENRAVYTNTQEDVTFAEIWFRNWAFYQLDDIALRDQLIERFPNGCYVAFANDIFCEARPENMDDHWRVCHALPGRGQLREPIGGSMIQIQEVLNDLTNIVRDVIEYTLPATFADGEVLDIRKWARSNVMAGAVYNVRARSGRAVQDSFWQTQPGQLPQYTGQLLADMRTEIPQFLSGTFPAAFGGGTPGNNALDVDTPIPTPRGFVRNGDLKDGGEIFGEDGKVYTITKAHPIRTDEAYRVVFDDGSEVVADAGHRWRTLTSKDRERIANYSQKHRDANRVRRRKLAGIPIDAPVGPSGPTPKSVPTPAIRTTREIMESLLDRRGRANHTVTVANPFPAPTADLPIDPWVLGTWLGNGASAHGLISWNDEDGASVAPIYAKAGYELKKLKSPNSWYVKGLMTKLRSLGVLGNKHVPDAYLWASPEQRLALLQGLMDTDGSASTEGKQFFSNTNRQLIDSVYHLAASLGCKPRVVRTEPSTVKGSPNGKTYTRSEGWLVCWSNSVPVFRMKRKAARVWSEVKKNVRKYRYIVAIEPVGDREMRCITVSNSTECYLCGPNFITTANTASGQAIEKDSAMGRIGLFWRAIKEHHADFAPLLIKEFVANGVDPEMITETTEGGSYVNIRVTPDDLKLGQIQAYCEVVEDYPTTWPQRQGLIMSMMQNPLFQQAIAKLSNLPEVKQTLGIDLEMPGEEAYKRQWGIIEELLASAPGVDELGNPVPSIMPDPLYELPPMAEACADFVISKRGVAEKQKATPGYQNFELYAMALKAAMAPPMPMPGPAGPPGEAGPPPPGPPQGPPIQ